MTISKERLNEIALEVAKEIYGSFNFSSQRLNLNDFALALIRRVGSECPVVGYIDCGGMLWAGVEEVLHSDTKLVTLPLVSEE